MQLRRRPSCTADPRARQGVAPSARQSFFSLVWLMVCWIHWPGAVVDVRLMQATKSHRPIRGVANRSCALHRPGTAAKHMPLRRLGCQILPCSTCVQLQVQLVGAILAGRSGAGTAADGICPLAWQGGPAQRSMLHGTKPYSYCTYKQLDSSQARNATDPTYNEGDTCSTKNMMDKAPNQATKLSLKTGFVQRIIAFTSFLTDRPSTQCSISCTSGCGR